MTTTLTTPTTVYTPTVVATITVPGVFTTTCYNIDQPQATAACSQVSNTENGEYWSFDKYASANGYTYDLNNNGNPDPTDYPPQYFYYDGALSPCDAATQCGHDAIFSLSNNQFYDTFDLHYRLCEAQWECVMFRLGSYGGYYDVRDEDVTVAFMYSLYDLYNT